MLQLKRLTEVYGMKVFTDGAVYFGDVEEAYLTLTRVYGWRIASSKNSFLSKVLGSTAKGVIVPHSLVKAVGDIFIISRAAVPDSGESSSDSLSAQGEAVTAV